MIFTWVVTINKLYGLKTKFELLHKNIKLSKKTTNLIRKSINLKKALRIGKFF